MEGEDSLDAFHFCARVIRRASGCRLWVTIGTTETTGLTTTETFPFGVHRFALATFRAGAAHIQVSWRTSEYAFSTIPRQENAIPIPRTLIHATNGTNIPLGSGNTKPACAVRSTLARTTETRFRIALYRIGRFARAGIFLQYSIRETWKKVWELRLGFLSIPLTLSGRSR